MTLSVFPPALAQSRWRTRDASAIRSSHRRAAELMQESATEREEEMHRSFLAFFSGEIVIRGKPMTSFRVPKEEQKLRERELAGKVTCNWNNKSLKQHLRNEFQISILNRRANLLRA